MDPATIKAFLPPELLFVIFEEVVRYSRDATELLRRLKMLGEVCTAWQGAVALMPHRTIVTTTLQQAQRLRSLFEDGNLAALSVRSLTMSTAPRTHHRGKPCFSDSKLTTLCAWLLKICPQVTDLCLGVCHSRVSAHSTFSPDLLQAPGLAKLQKLTIKLWNSTHSEPGALGPLLSGCRDLVDLTIEGSFAAQRSPMGASPPYALSSFSYRVWSRSRQTGPDPFLAFALAQTKSLKRMIVWGNGRALEVLRLAPQSWTSLEEVGMPLPLGAEACALPRLKRGHITWKIRASEVKRIVASPATVVRLANYVAESPWAKKVFLPFLRQTRASSLALVEVEYNPCHHYDTLDRLELIEDVCIERGIEFDLVDGI